MAGKLAGRVAIVTGAGSGIGQATAARLAAESAFAVVNDLVEERSEKTAALIREHGGQAESHPGDVTSLSFVDALVEAAVARHGRLDVFHSNAGFGAARDELAVMSDSAWHADIELDLTSMFYCVRAAVRAMREAGGGSVICTSSGAALGAVSGTAPYGTAKAAIRSSSATPRSSTGRAACASTRSSLRRQDRGVHGLHRHRGAARALRRADPAPARVPSRGHRQRVLWLASDDSACVTGIGLVVDGGASAKRAEPHVD